MAESFPEKQVLPGPRNGRNGSTVSIEYAWVAGGPSINARLVAINAAESQRYIDDTPARNRYGRHHPTRIACLKCMDGRVHLPVMTGTPTGIVKPFRAIGGRFRPSWPSFTKRLGKWVDVAEKQFGHRCVILITYHFSAAGERDAERRHLGCTGWNYDVAAARTHAEWLREKLAFVYGEQADVIVTGVETDGDNLMLHGTEGIVSGSECIGADDDAIALAIRRAFPTLDRQTVADLVPLLAGNATHVAALQRHPRRLDDLGHQERIIAVGQDFAWLARSNLALIINDIDPNLGEAIVTGAGIIERNLDTAPDGDDAVLFANVPFGSKGTDERQAMVRSLDLLEMALDAIRIRRPELVASGRLHALAGITFEESKELTVLHSSIPIR